MILSIVFWTIVNNAMATILTVLIGFVVPDVMKGDGIYILTILTSFVVLYLFRRWFSPEFKGSLKTMTPMKEILVLCGPLLLMTVAAFVTSMIFYGGFFKPTLHGLILALFAGVNEEITFGRFPCRSECGF